MADGIKIIIRADIREAEKAFRALEQQAAKVKNLETEYASLKKEYAAAGKAAEKSAKDVDAAFAKLQAAKSKQAAIAAGLKEQFNFGRGVDTSDAYRSALAGNADYKKAAAEVEQLKATLSQLHTTMSEAEVRQGELADSVRNAEAGVTEERQELGRLTERAKEAARHVERVNQAFNAVKKFASSVVRGVASVGKAFASICGKIKTAAANLGLFRQESKKGQGATRGFSKAIIKLGTMLKMAILRKVIQGMIRAVREGFENLAQYSAECNSNMSTLMSSLTQLKNSFATAFNSILSIATPALTSLINQLSKAVTYIGMLFAALSGATTFTKAAAVTENYAKSVKSAGKAAKEAQASFDTLEVLSDNGKDTGVASPSEMFEVVQIPSWMQGIKDMITGEDWVGLGAYVADSINSGLTKLKLTVSWDNVGDAITDMVNGITGTLNALVDNIDWELMGQALGTGLNTLVNTLFLLFTGIDWYSLGSSLATGLNGMISTIDWEHLGETIGAWLDTSIHSALGFVQTFDWGAAGLSLATSLQGMVDSIDWAALGELIGDSLIGAFTFLSTAVEEFDWVQFGEDVKTMLVNIDWAGVFEAMCRAMGAAFGGLTGFLWGLLKDAWEDIVDWWEDHAFEDGKFTIQGLLDGIVEVFSNIGKWIKEHIFQPFIDGFKNAFGIHSPSTVMKEQGGFIIDGLKEGLTGLWDGIKGFFTDAIDNIKETFSLDNLKNVGSNAVTGLMNGLGSVGSKVLSWGSGILDNIKDSLGIHSPSTETEEVGEYTVAGYINGLDAYAGKLKTSLDGVSYAILDMFSKTAQMVLDQQMTSQDNYTRGLSDWMSAVKDSFASFYSGLNTQADNWAAGLQSTLSKMVRSAKNTASSIGSSLSTARSNSSAISSYSNTSGARSTAARVNAGIALRVPAYATGAVLPANNPHLAIVGDQKSGTNIETQMRTMVAAFNAALDSRGGDREILNGMREILDAIREGKVLMVGQRELGRVVEDALALSSRTAGTSIIRVR